MILAQIAVAIVIALVFNQVYIGLKILTTELSVRLRKKRSETKK